MDGVELEILWSNLIGIVTFTIRDAQNLNFAISASMFWRASKVAITQLP